MNPQKHNMAVLGQIVKLIPRKIIESLRKKHKIQTRSFTATSHVPGTVKHYSGKLRMVIADVWVDNKLKRMTFLSNNMTWAASSICELYKSRWAIEVFFKEIKQTLQLADFMGTSENAVKWQIWTALLTYLLLRFIAWKHQWMHSFHRLFTLIRAILWNFLNLEAVLKACEKVKSKSNKPPPTVPKQIEFYF